MKDKLKQELEIGDTVVFLSPGYKDLRIGKIIKFTNKGYHIEWNENNIKKSQVRFECIKINEQIKIAKEKYPENYI